MTDIRLDTPLAEQLSHIIGACSCTPTADNCYFWSHDNQTHEDDLADLQAILSAIQAEVWACMPKDYTLKTGLLWDSQDATDGYHQAMAGFTRNAKERGLL